MVPTQFVVPENSFPALLKAHPSRWSQAPMGFQFSCMTAVSSWRVASWMSATLPVVAASKIISAVRSQTGRAWRNGSKSRIRMAASINVTSCERGPPVSVIVRASFRDRSSCGSSRAVAGPPFPIQPVPATPPGRERPRERGTGARADKNSCQTARSYSRGVGKPAPD